jgi:hypothetical protein
MSVRKSQIQPLLVLGLLAGLISACASSQTSVLIADHYDAATDQTVLVVVPYGNISLPGKWTKTSYNEVSRQHFFSNGDSTTVAVAKQPREKYPFYAAGQNDAQFVVAFQNWDAQYWRKNGMLTTVVEDRSSDGVIVWNVAGERINTTFLFGSKNNYAYNLSVSSKRWNDPQVTKFLLELYAAN